MGIKKLVWLLLLGLGLSLSAPVLTEDHKASTPVTSFVQAIEKSGENDTTNNIGTLEPDDKIHPLTPPATRSPRSTLNEFLNKSRAAITIIHQVETDARQHNRWLHKQEHIEEGNHAEELLEQAVRTLDLSSIPEAQRLRLGLERALMLKEVLERIPLPPMQTVPGIKEVIAADKTSEDENKLERWEIPGTEIAIVRGSKNHYVGEYLFSPETVERVPEFFAQVHDLPVTSTQMKKQRNFYDYYSSTPGHMLPPRWSLWLPEWSKGQLYLDQTLWQWCALILTLMLSLSSSAYLMRWHIRRIHGDEHTLLDVLIPLVIGFGLWCERYLIEDVLNITGMPFVAVSFALQSLIIISASWFTYIFINWLAEKIWTKKTLRNGNLDVSLIRTTLRLISLIGAGVVIYFGAESLGIPIAPLLAGFGALGLAIGIGAQEYFKNVVGGLTLFLDRPIRIGEECQFDNFTGIVEEIGLRSSQLRTPDNELIIVPNAHFSSINITNLSRIPNRVINFCMNLSQNTNSDTLLLLITSIRSYLKSIHWAKESRVRFASLDDGALTIEVRIVVNTINEELFYEYREIVLLKVMKIVEEAGVKFAEPPA